MPSLYTIDPYELFPQLLDFGMKISIVSLLSWLALAAAVNAATLSPSDLPTPEEREKYAELAASKPADAERYLAARGYMREAAAFVAAGKALKFTDRPKDLDIRAIDWSTEGQDLKTLRAAGRLSNKAWAASWGAPPVRGKLTPAAEAFLRTNGLDPASPEAAWAIADGVIHTVYRGDPEEMSLETLASRGKKTAIWSFVATRIYARRLKKNFASTGEPVAEFDPLYLTVEERVLAGRRYKEK